MKKLTVSESLLNTVNPAQTNTDYLRLAPIER